MASLAGKLPSKPAITYLVPLASSATRMQCWSRADCRSFKVRRFADEGTRSLVLSFALVAFSFCCYGSVFADCAASALVTHMF